ncbi:MAG: hypothetical protein EBS84_21985 [Proteobacteria bacterium]|nr:hypothetical protein [Pseudomonadota bacterium]
MGTVAGTATRQQRAKTQRRHAKTQRRHAKTYADCGATREDAAHLLIAAPNRKVEGLQGRAAVLGGPAARRGAITV